MILQHNGVPEFASVKEMIAYIKQFDEIECERDTSRLYELIEMFPDLVEEVSVKEGTGGLYVEKGDLQYDLADYADHYGAIIVGCVIIGEYEFTKAGYYGRWEPCDRKKFAKLPVGYSDEELEDLFDSSDYAQDEWDLVSEALDAAVDNDTAFSYEYRDYRSVDDDLQEIERQLEELPYDGYYERECEYECPEGVRNVGHRVYGWKRSEDADLPETDLITTEEAARFLAEAAGILTTAATNGQGGV